MHHDTLRDEWARLRLRRLGCDGPQWPLWTFECEGDVGYISYNGRVWEGLPLAWTPETREIKVDRYWLGATFGVDHTELQRDLERMNLNG